MVGTGETESATVTVPLADSDYRLFSANANTGLAVDTKMRFEAQLRVGAPRFRVLAPDAAQRTAFEKDQTAHPRPVMQAEVLDGEDQRLRLRAAIRFYMRSSQ
jgi:hypothetical protein